MTLADIISASSVHIASEVSSKKRALEELANILAQATEDLDAREIFTALVNREKLGSTGLGSGVGIPHGRISGLDQAVGAVIKLPAPIDFESVDRKGVDLLFGLIVPKEATQLHLQTLAAIAELCQDDSVVGKMREASDAESLYAVLASKPVGD
nr:PTS IIA-like nitrogen regulatory protein PtsN [Oceanococcus sp. HetDA_MAG_MS8]